MPEAPEGGWTLEAVEAAQFPTRMARRRALQTTQIEDLWAPDPSVTETVLERVEDELFRLLDRQIGADGEDEAPNVDDDGRSRSVWQPVAGPGLLAGGDRPAYDGDLLPGSARRSHGRLLRRVALVVVAAACAGGVVTWALAGRPDPTPPVTAAASASQQVLAVALVDQAQITGISLLASGGAGAQQVLVPSRLLLDVPGAGRLPMAQSLAPGAQAPGAALADALEIRVDGTWVLDRADLARLVDAVGGVDVDVDVDVTQGVGAGASIVVAQGTGQHLNGSQAAAYAQLLVGAEPEAARLARQERVVTGLLGLLPTDRDSRLALVTSGSAPPTGSVLDVVLSTTGALHDPAREATLGSTVLPVRDIDSGGDVTSYGLDTQATQAMVSARLAGAALVTPVGGRTKVLVQNGVGSPGLGEAARARLVAAGMSYVGGGNVAGFGVTESVVVLSDGSSPNRARGLAVARALGLPDSALRISDTSPTIADLVVVLGSDFKQT